MLGWWIAAAFLIIIVALLIYNNRLKHQLRQETGETTRLRYKLSATRQELAEVNARRKKLLAASTQALIIIENDFRTRHFSRLSFRFICSR